MYKKGKEMRGQRKIERMIDSGPKGRQNPLNIVYK